MPSKNRPLKKDKLTVQHKDFCRNLIKTKKVGLSARKAGFLHGGYGSYLLAQPQIQNYIIQLMDEAGLGDRELIGLIKEGANAMTPEVRSVKGDVLRESVPDFYNRKDYIKMALQMRGRLKSDNVREGDRTINIQLNIGTLTGLHDSGAINTQEFQELQELQHEPIRDQA